MGKINELALVLGVVLFSIGNFAGRLSWGWLSDFIKNSILIPSALTLMGVSALLLGYLKIASETYLMLAFIAGFSFGANFVLFAKETIHAFGLKNYNKTYPFVFLGYGIAGIVGPTFGGWLYDLFGNFVSSLLFSFALCLFISTVYILFQIFNKTKKIVS